MNWLGKDSTLDFGGITAYIHLGLLSNHPFNNNKNFSTLFTKMSHSFLLDNTQLNRVFCILADVPASTM